MKRVALTVQEKREWMRKVAKPIFSRMRGDISQPIAFIDDCEAVLDHGSDQEIENLWKTIFEVHWQFEQRHEASRPLST
jgi:hypothetical protein